MKPNAYRYRVLAALTLLTCSGLGIAQEVGHKAPFTAEESELAKDRIRAITAISPGQTVPFTLPAVFSNTFFSGDYSHRVEIPTGVSVARFILTTSSVAVDVDMYVRRGAEPFPNSSGRPVADYIAEGLSGNETIIVSSPSAGSYYIAYGLFTLGRTANSSIRVELEGSCSYSLSPSSMEVADSGGNVVVQVITSPGCAWTASSPVSWALLQGATSGSGTGTVVLNVSPNASTAARNALVTVAGQVFSLVQRGAPSGGPVSPSATRFVSIEPCRLMETRPEYNFEGRTGTFGPPFLFAGETRTMNLNASTVCRNIPASAKAIVLNATLVPRGVIDFVTVYPAGESRPAFYTLRSLDGLIVANSSIVRVGVNSGISVYASQAADLIIDVSGYFTDDPLVSTLVYYPLNPCRVIETRAEYRPVFGPFGPPALNFRETRTFRFPGNPYCVVPAGAAAYSVTVTVVPPGPLAFLTAWPAGRPLPNVSSMNSPAGRVLANSIIVPASADGSINLYAFDRTDVIVDINGYFAPDDGINGLYFFPVRQCRFADTTDFTLGAGFNGPIYGDETTRTISVPASARCTDVPFTARAFALNATVIPNGNPMPFLTIWPAGLARPNASVINAFQGQSVSSGFIVPAGTGGGINVFAYRRTDVVLEVSGYFGR